tara:strand:+ start:509 stop:697 length:189 start_codon:yes stop_codon:yes gene_type:complete
MINLYLVGNIELGGVDLQDYPDFSDAYIEYAEYDEVEMTVDQLSELNDDSEFVLDCVMEQLF